jgi:hypothetical protein
MPANLAKPKLSTKQLDVVTACLSPLSHRAIRYNGAVRSERGYPMPAPSLQAKKAYFAKVRQSNYAASLRLEGFDVTPADADRKLPTREAALDAYRNKQG